MEASGAGSAPEGPGRDPHHRRRPPAGADLHKAVIVVAVGSLACAAGGLLFLLRRAGAAETSASAASACVSVGLMLVVVGLVWTPILKEEHRRKCYSGGDSLGP